MKRETLRQTTRGKPVHLDEPTMFQSGISGIYQDGFTCSLLESEVRSARRSTDNLLGFFFFFKKREKVKLEERRVLRGFSCQVFSVAARSLGLEVSAEVCESVCAY